MKINLILGLLLAATSSMANAIEMDHTNDSVFMTFDNLSEHTEVNLNFDLYIMDSWDGNEPTYGIDVFGFKIDDVVQGEWSFRNFSQNPGDESNEDNSWITGNFNSVNFWGEIDRKFIDYNDGFTFAHTGSTLSLEFYGSGLQEIFDESWRVEEVSLVTSSLSEVPVPAAVWLFGSALLGLSGMRRKVS